jgi:hypothetical protein
MGTRMRFRWVLGLVWLGAALDLAAVRAQTSVEARNVILVGHHDLNGNGDGGRGAGDPAVAGWPPRPVSPARGSKTCLSIVDVTHPENRVLIRPFLVTREDFEK